MCRCTRGTQIGLSSASRGLDVRYTEVHKALLTPIRLIYIVQMYRPIQQLRISVVE